MRYCYIYPNRRSDIDSMGRYQTVKAWGAFQGLFPKILENLGQFFEIQGRVWHWSAGGVSESDMDGGVKIFL